MRSRWNLAVGLFGMGAVALVLACSGKGARTGGDGGGTPPVPDDGAVDVLSADAGGGAPFVTPVALARPTEVQYLSGRGSDDAVTWDFYCSSAVSTNRNCANAPGSGAWSSIPVPSNWELQGFGTYYYGTDNGFSRGPSETGFYRRSFDAPAAWRGKRIQLVFEGAMTDTDVEINGVSAGPTHRGGFYRFAYDVSGSIRFGSSNTIEVAVTDESANPSISSAERSADYWVFGGLFRPVYLRVYPAESMARVGIDARADGTLSVNVALEGVAQGADLTARVLDTRAQQVGPTLAVTIAAGQTSAQLSGVIPGIDAWSAETPSLYRVLLSLDRAGSPLHQTVETFGFRTVEVRPGDGVYVNGKKVMFRGINRHSFWPTSGRALNASISHDDVALLKGMNVNAVRSSHYPPDRHFLDAADTMGLYVLDELAGWQHAYDTPGGTPLVGEMIDADANHPSVIFWDNGNEGGWNVALDPLFGQLDLQRRKVLHPQQLSSGIQASHYPNYAAAQAGLAGPNVFMPTEFLHGLYDGGGGAGLDDYWNLMRGSPRSAGGFLWALLDEGVVRTDDPQKRIDTKGNQAPDGVVGPYREKEGSYYAIRDVWAPLQVTLGSLPSSFLVENRYDFTDARTVTFRWQLVDFDFRKTSSGHTVVADGIARTDSIAPGTSGALALSGIPSDWADHHALLLSAEDATRTTIGQWSWMIATPETLRASIVASGGSSPANCGSSSTGVARTVTSGGVSYTFDNATGLLSGATRGAGNFAFQHGPTLVTGGPAGVNATNGPLQSFSAAQQGNDCVLTATYAGSLSQIVWQVFSSGWLRVSYRYRLTGAYDFYGVSFDYPESRVQGVQWLGRGPNRVWKNRMKGVTTDVWTRDYNDAITGAVWTYPEFKGYFADVRWARLFTTDGVIHFVFEQPDTFLRLFSAKDGAGPQTTQMAFPPPLVPGGAAGISFLQGIPAIGTKFDAAAALGPQSAAAQLDAVTFDQTVDMFFGDVNELP